MVTSPVVTSPSHTAAPQNTLLRHYLAVRIRCDFVDGGIEEAADQHADGRADDEQRYVAVAKES